MGKRRLNYKYSFMLSKVFVGRAGGSGAGISPGVFGGVTFVTPVAFPLFFSAAPFTSVSVLASLPTGRMIDLITV